MTRTWKNLAGVAAMLLGGVGSASADYVVLNNGTKMEGKDARCKLDGTVMITLAAGRQEFAKGSYKVAVCDPPPAEFVAGVQAYRGQKYQQAIDTLEKVADEKMGLEVDKQARYVIARSYAAMGKAGEGVSQFDKLARIYGEPVRKEPAVAVEYAGALLAAGQHEKLGGVLDDIIKDAPRNLAAKAQTLRGQMKEKQGQVDAAITDYMRTVIFFEQEEDAVPEALYRAAKAFESKRDPRAKNLYKKLTDEYSNSPYAREAAGKG